MKQWPVVPAFTERRLFEVFLQNKFKQTYTAEVVISILPDKQGLLLAPTFLRTFLLPINLFCSNFYQLSQSYNFKNH